METKPERRKTLAWLEGSLAQSITSFLLDTHPRKLIQFGLMKNLIRRPQKYPVRVSRDGGATLPGFTQAATAMMRSVARQVEAGGPLSGSGAAWPTPQRLLTSTSTTPCRHELPRAKMNGWKMTPTSSAGSEAGGGWTRHAAMATLFTAKPCLVHED